MNADSLTGSIFSQVIQGSAPGVIVYEDDACVVLMDAFPMLPGHVLVIPRVEHIRIRDLAPSLRSHLFHIAALLTQAMADLGISCGDANIVINDGKHSGQSVPHVHLHVVPRRAKDGFPFPALVFNVARKLSKKMAPEDELQAIAARMRQSLQSLLANQP